MYREKVIYIQVCVGVHIHMHTGIFYHKEEWNNICSNMGRTGHHHIKFNKSCSER